MSQYIFSVSCISYFFYNKVNNKLLAVTTGTVSNLIPQQYYRKADSVLHPAQRYKNVQQFSCPLHSG